MKLLIMVLLLSCSKEKNSYVNKSIDLMEKGDPHNILGDVTTLTYFFYGGSSYLLNLVTYFNDDKLALVSQQIENREKYLVCDQINQILAYRRWGDLIFLKMSRGDDQESFLWVTDGLNYMERLGEFKVDPNDFKEYQGKIYFYEGNKLYFLEGKEVKEFDLTMWPIQRITRLVKVKDLLAFLGIVDGKRWWFTFDGDKLQVLRFVHKEEGFVF